MLQKETHEQKIDGNDDQVDGQRKESFRLEQRREGAGEPGGEIIQHAAEKPAEAEPEKKIEQAHVHAVVHQVAEGKSEPLADAAFRSESPPERYDVVADEADEVADAVGDGEPEFVLVAELKRGVERPVHQQVDESGEKPHDKEAREFSAVLIPVFLRGLREHRRQGEPGAGRFVCRG